MNYTREEIVVLLHKALNKKLMGMVEIISAKSEKIGANLYVVGGFVRDLLLDRPNVDFDLVIEGESLDVVPEIAEIMRREFGGRIILHRRFGTAKWILPSKLAGELGLDILDFAATRSEFYEEPTKLPVVQPDNIGRDLYRRDFTVNTIAISLSQSNFGEIIDLWNGMYDLNNKRLDVLHRQSFGDDPTRILRAVRLEERLGFNISDRVLIMIEESLGLLEKVTADRIRHEIEKILSEDYPENILARLCVLGIGKAICDELDCRNDGWLKEKFALVRSFDLVNNISSVYFGLWLYDLSEEEIGNVSRRLNLASSLEKSLMQVCRTKSNLNVLANDINPSVIVEILDGITEVAMQILLISTNDAVVMKNILQYYNKFRFVKPIINGDTLIEMGLDAGPDIGRILAKLKVAWLDGYIHDLESEKKLAIKLIGDS